eukprot:PhM_4_TR13416/c0_g1_i1/m.81865/K00939/adk, AK; adenylate kinase
MSWVSLRKLVKRSTAPARITPRRVVVLGMPGVGKSTYAQHLADSHGLPYISCGDVFCSSADPDPAWISAVRRGDIPDDAAWTARMLAVIDRRVASCGGYVLDGYPHTISQALLLDSSEMRPTTIVHLTLPYHRLVERLSASCPCGSVPVGRCAHCGTDCGSEAVLGARRRLTAFHEQVDPVLQYYATERLDGAAPRLLECTLERTESDDSATEEALVM